jgi:hypothetical protein
MELEGSLLCSQVTTSCSYVDPDQSSTWAPTSFSHIHYNIPSMLRSPKWSCFLTNTLYAFLLFHMCNMPWHTHSSWCDDSIFDEEQHTGPPKKKKLSGTHFGIYCPEIINKICCEIHAFSFSTHVMGNLLTVLEQQVFLILPSIQWCLSFPLVLQGSRTIILSS